MSKDIFVGRPEKLEKLRYKVGDIYCHEKERILGKILTIVDASFADGGQRKAMKDIVKQSFWEDATYAETIDNEFKLFSEAANLPFKTSQDFLDEMQEKKEEINVVSNEYKE
jgi:hypothetical protein